MINKEKYFKIINELCSYNEISKEEFIDVLIEKDMKYLFILFLKKYNCLREDELKEIFKVKTKRSIYYNYKKAEEKLLINREFRGKYFELEKRLEEIL